MGRRRGEPPSLENYLHRRLGKQVCASATSRRAVPVVDNTANRVPGRAAMEGAEMEGSEAGGCCCCRAESARLAAHMFVPRAHFSNPASPKARHMPEPTEASSDSRAVPGAGKTPSREPIPSDRPLPSRFLGFRALQGR
ncbi:uncharacterized protein B0I36DRAFT_343956 [Microdochium trichocladiopsis]|uniref:Uncharacterized protein n=1 Tax=Microdochium trichocladiopsis TaxID=1682393 RepID=A0A9P9BVE2_9PEZI|nr:uncharacterized protein B0I36DRAFT_343956 [Microdochium trichocladiopsis]KAH7040168.1 hypothetical protein B0I36DRAFT_343956 [Microdochium trichocladiopsis]